MANNQLCTLLCYDERVIVVVVPSIDAREWAPLVRATVRVASADNCAVVCCGDGERAETFAAAVVRRLPSVQTILERQSQSEAEGIVFATSFLPVDAPVTLVSSWWQLRLRWYARHWRQTGHHQVRWIRCGGVRGWLHVTSELLLMSNAATDVLHAQRREETLIADEQTM